MNDFNAFPPEPVALDLAGETLSITPIRVGEIPALLTTIRPFVGQLAGDDPDWFALFAEHGQALIRAVALASRRPVEWVESLEGDDAIRLAAMLVEVNADFFVNRMVPAIQHAAARVDMPIPRLSAGPRPSTA